MQPYTREIIERRHPAMRWSAVFAGTAVAVGIWALLQVLGMGAGLAALGGGHEARLHSIGVGTTVWSLIVPFIATFIGGWIAGKLAGTSGALHGAVVWALTSALGIFVVASFISSLVTGSTETGSVYDASSPAAAGKALLVAGASMLVGLVTALIGGSLAVRRLRHRERLVVPPATGVDTAGY